MTIEVEPLTCAYYGYFKPPIHRQLNNSHYIADDFKGFDHVAAEIGLSSETTSNLVKKMDFASHSYILLYKASSRLNTDFTLSQINVVGDAVHLKFFEIVPPQFMLIFSSMSRPFLSSQTSFQGIDEMIKSAQIIFFQINKDHRHVVVSSDTELKDLRDIRGFELLKERDAMEEEVKRLYDKIAVLKQEKIKPAEVKIAVTKEDVPPVDELAQARREVNEKSYLIRSQDVELRKTYRSLIGNPLVGS